MAAPSSRTIHHFEVLPTQFRAEEVAASVDEDLCSRPGAIKEIVPPLVAGKDARGGKLPAEGAIDVSGVKVASDDMKELTSVDKEGWKAELPLIKEHFATFGAKLPKGLNDELAALEQRLG